MNESQQLNDAYYQQQQQQKIHYQQQQIHQQNQINQQHQQNILYQQQLQQHQLQQQIHQQNQINQQHQQNILYQQQLQQHQLQQQIHQQNQINQQHQQNTQNQQQVQHHQLQQLLYQQNQIKQQHQQQLQASPHHNLVLTWTPPPCFKSSPILHHHLIYCTLYHDDVTSDSNASNLTGSPSPLHPLLLHHMTNQTEHCTDQRSYIVPSFMTYFTLVGLQTGKTYRIKVRSFGLEGRYVDSDQLEYRPQEWRGDVFVIAFCHHLLFLLLSLLFYRAKKSSNKQRGDDYDHHHLFPHPTHCFLCCQVGARWIDR